MQRVLAMPVIERRALEQLPRVRSVIERTWDDEWTTLYLEFVLYAKRNPEAREKLAASARRQREMTIGMLERAYASHRRRARLPDPGAGDALDRVVRGARARPARRPAVVHAGDAHRRADVPLRRRSASTTPTRQADGVARASERGRLAAALLPARRADAHERVADAVGEARHDVAGQLGVGPDEVAGLRLGRGERVLHRVGDLRRPERPSRGPRR